MQVSFNDFRRELIPDECPDTSYLEQEGWEDRLTAYRRDEFGFIGVRAIVELKIPSKQGGYWNTQKISSPGLWGIETDSGEDYFDEVFREECEQLAEMLEQMGMVVADMPKSARMI
jgi:hypothetical protein